MIGDKNENQTRMATSKAGAGRLNAMTNNPYDESASGFVPSI
jgi:hypothetical protein